MSNCLNHENPFKPREIRPNVYQLRGESKGELNSAKSLLPARAKPIILSAAAK
jgi:hypothetical protein